MWNKGKFSSRGRKSKTIFLIDDIKSTEYKKWNEAGLTLSYPSSN